ncbi:hypothetical protein ES703_99261 [subsurface metagenome]
MTYKPQQDPELAQTIRIIKIGFFIAVGVGVIVMLVSIVRSCQMARIRSVATRTVHEAGSKATDDFFTLYADCFNSKTVYGFTCKYDSGAKVLSFSGNFTAQTTSSDPGVSVKWQVDKVLLEIIQSIGPRIKELQAVELSNFLADDVGQTAVWRARLPLSALSPSTLENKDRVKQYVQQYIRVQEDTASGRYFGTKRRH